MAVEEKWPFCGGEGNMTPVLFVDTTIMFFFNKMFILAYKDVTKSKYVNKTKT